MAQIIQYKDRERDTSVYPVTVGAAVYMDFKDSSTYQTLDDVMAIKPDSIILYDASYDSSVGYVCLAVDHEQILDGSQQAIAIQNLGIQDIVNDWRVCVSDITLMLENKQDKTVSGQHIKTINGVNIVGPGNVDIYKNENLIGIDSSLDKDSSNAIMNSTMWDYLWWENITKE